MHHIRLGERKRAPHKAAHPLAQNVVETLDMTGLTLAFVGRSMTLCGQDLRVSVPEIRVEHSFLIGLGHTGPEQSASLVAAITNSIGHDLTGSAT